MNKHALQCKEATFHQIEKCLDFENSFDKDVIDELTLRGHKINYPAPLIGGGQMIFIDNDQEILIGASDWRKDGLAIGY